MALRYLARTLRRTSVRRTSLPAGSRGPIRGSPQGGCSNRTKNDVGGKAKKEFEGMNKNWYDEEISKCQAKVQAASEAMRSQRIHRWCLLASAAGGTVLGFLAIAIDAGLVRARP